MATNNPNEIARLKRREESMRDTSSNSVVLETIDAQSQWMRDFELRLRALESRVGMLELFAKEIEQRVTQLTVEGRSIPDLAQAHTEGT